MVVCSARLLFPLASRNWFLLGHRGPGRQITVGLAGRPAWVGKAQLLLKENQVFPGNSRHDKCLFGRQPAAEGCGCFSERVTINRYFFEPSPRVTGASFH